MAVGCGAGPGETTGRSSQALEALLPMAGCDEAEAFVKEAAIASMNREIDERIAQLDARLEKDPWASTRLHCHPYPSRGVGGSYDAGAPSGSGGAGNAGSPSSGNSSAPIAGSAGAAPPPSASGGSAGAEASSADSSGSAKNVSGTNNQVTGVDEADFVKNDAKYVYAAMNGALRIVDAWPPAQAHEVSRTPIEGTVKKLFVHADRALVYVSVPRPGTSSSSNTGAYVPPRGSGKECTYGYDCSFEGDGTATKILIFDVTDRAQPRKLREIATSGALVAARRVGDAVHTVVTTPSIQFKGLRTSPRVSCEGAAMTYGEYVAKVKVDLAKVRLENEALIQATPVRELFPWVLDDLGGAPADVLAGCGGAFRSATPDGASFTTLLSLDMVNPGAPRAASVLSKAGAVYASGTALYVAVTHKRASVGGGWYGGMEGEDEASTVHRFRIGEDPALTGYEASGVVKGHVLNQFGMDEAEGRLRIATTVGKVPDPKVRSALTVLERQAHDLVKVGLVDDIAPTEDIRSVRFDGDRGFIVTFKKTDPLFVLDLADPRAPRILGELKIPGFSTYMHMMDPSHLLTIGYDADDRGSFAYFSGVLLQIFDVSDPANPRLAHKHVIGTRGSSSEALTNHLAFTYYAPKNLLALPMTVCEGGNGGGFGNRMTFSGLMVFDVTKETGFAERGRVHHTPASGQYNNAACSNWWTNASSAVKRSIVMDDHVLSVSDEVLKATALAQLGTPVSSVSLAP